MLENKTATKADRRLGRLALAWVEGRGCPGGQQAALEDLRAALVTLWAMQNRAKAEKDEVARLRRILNGMRGVLVTMDRTHRPDDILRLLDKWVMGATQRENRRS